jgi:hypothetical protein
MSISTNEETMKMDESSFARLPQIHLELDKFDLLNVPVDQTKIGQKIRQFTYTVNEWINLILKWFPMNIKGEITFLFTYDTKIFLLKVTNLVKLQKFINYVLDSNYSIYQGFSITHVPNIHTRKIYPMNYFMDLTHPLNSLVQQTESKVFKYANYDIVMSRISNHKDQMKNTVDHLFKGYFSYVFRTESIYTRKMQPYSAYYYKGKYYNTKNYKLWDSSLSTKWYADDSNFSILEKKPKNLLQIWNTRYLEKIDF